MSTLFYRNPRILILTICLILVAGLSSYQILPRQEDPEMAKRFGIVKIYFPGAKPERIESLITEKLEEKLSEIEEIKLLRSITSAGIAIIRIELKEKVRASEVESVWSRLRNKLRDGALLFPKGAGEPEFEIMEAKAFTMIASLVWHGKGEADFSLLYRTGKNLEQSLWSIPGTEKIKFYGRPYEEVLVHLKEKALENYGFTALEISNLIAQSDSKISAGQLQASKHELLLEVKSELDSLDRLRNIPLRKGKRGEMVYLRDLATVEKSVQNPPQSLSFIDGKPGLSLAIHMESSRRIDRWAFAAEKKVEEFRKNLPASIDLKIIFDQSKYTEERLSNLFWNLMMGAFLVAFVVLAMMGWRSALIVSLALPLSVLTVLFGFRILSIPIHQMSVAGLIIALGLLIDNAIVIADEVQMRLKEGKKAIDALSHSVKQLAIPLLGSTLTTVFTFMPIALMPGGAGEFVSTMAISVILALFSSMFLSLTVIATLTAYSHKWSSSSPLESWWKGGYSNASWTALYRKSLSHTFSRPFWGILISMAFPIAGFILLFFLDEQFFPQAQRDQIQVEMELPSSTSLQETARTALKARKLLLKYPEVKEVQWFIGENAPSFYYNIPRGKEHSPNYAQALIQLHAWKGEGVIRQLQAELDASLPQARSLVRQLEQGPPFDAPVELRIYGPDFEVLHQWGEKVRQKLASIPDVIHTRSSLSEALPKVEFCFQEEKVLQAGLNFTSLSMQLQSQLDGSMGGSLVDEREDLPVRVRMEESTTSNLKKIASLHVLVPTSKGRKPVPLSTFGSLRLVPELSTIYRKNRQRYNSVQGFITAGVLSSQVLSKFKPEIEKLIPELPEGYFFEFGGESQERNETVGTLMASVGVLLTFMIITLVLSFDSFRMAAIIGIVGIFFYGAWIFVPRSFPVPLWFYGHCRNHGACGSGHQ